MSTRIGTQDNGSEIRSQQVLERTKAPLCPEESLAALFNAIGITNLVTGDIQGRYGHEWGHINPADLDQVMLSSCILQGSHGLLRTTVDPRTVDFNLAPGAEVDPAVFGYLEPVEITTDDGAKYLFTSVTYKDEQFLITTMAEKPEGVCVDARLSLTELRELMGIHMDFPSDTAH